MEIIEITLLIALISLVIASTFMLFGLKKKSETIINIVKYIFPLTLIIHLFLWNSFVDNEETAYQFFIFTIAFLVNGKNIYSDYISVMKKPLNKEGYHFCISSIISIVLIFTFTYSAIEKYIPNSFSNISTNDPVAMSIDFIYFSVTTFTTVGFGDITPQTTLARAVVTLEIITAFAMLVLAVNFLVRKKDNNKTEAEKDEISNK